MKFVLFWCLLVVVVTAIHVEASKKSRAMNSELLFKNCKSSTCKVGGYNGYDCYQGHCDYVCDSQGCEHSKEAYQTESFKSSSLEERQREKKAYATRIEEVQDKEQSQYKGRDKFSGRVDFSDCSSEHCSNGNYEGYDCKHGNCGYICKGSDCYLSK